MRQELKAEIGAGTRNTIAINGATCGAALAKPLRAKFWKSNAGRMYFSATKTNADRITLAHQGAAVSKLRIVSFVLSIPFISRKTYRWNRSKFHT